MGKQWQAGSLVVHSAERSSRLAVALTVLIPLTMSRMGSAVRPGVLSGMLGDPGLSLLVSLEELAYQ